LKYISTGWVNIFKLIRRYLRRYAFGILTFYTKNKKVCRIKIRIASSRIDLSVAYGLCSGISDW